MPSDVVLRTAKHLLQRQNKTKPKIYHIHVHVLISLGIITNETLENYIYCSIYFHGGARPPPVCAHRAWVDFNGAGKVCKGLWVSPYWILVLKWSTLTQFCRILVLAMQIWRPFQEIANFYLLVDIYQG